MIEEANFLNFFLGKAFEKQTKTIREDGKTKQRFRVFKCF